mgnify:CR=1 FL=1
MDVYGRGIKLTFQGQDAFRTKFGAFCTILIGIIFLSYAAFKAINIINLKDVAPNQSQLSYSEYLRLFDEKPTDYDLGDDDNFEGSVGGI